MRTFGGWWRTPATAAAVAGLLAIGWADFAMARAGGAGGGGGGHGGGGGGFGGGGGGGFSGGHSYGTGGGGGSMSPGTFLLFLIIVVVVIAVSNANKRGGGGSTGPLITGSTDDSGGGDESGDEAPEGPRVDAASLAAFHAAHPDFDEAAFRRKVSASFTRIQVAWSAQDLSGARAFISDGTYQRFTTQFQMMRLLEQRNELSNVGLHAVELAAARVDGEFDVLDVYVQARMHDAFVSNLDHSLDTAGDSEFAEYWSFIRKRKPGVAKGDVYAASTCPACGAPLPDDMGEVCTCKYCHSLVNSGEFDWVLAEITQQQDYGARSVMLRIESADLPQAVARMNAEAPDFSVQMTEDKASNAYMQIMTALAKREPALARRFVSDAAFAQIQAMLTPEPVIFDRIYLNEVVLLAARRVGERHVLDVGVTATLLRVQLRAGGGFTKLDPQPVARHHVLTLERDVAAALGKGALYQHQCGTCGAPIKDSIDVKCPYCSAALNSTAHEWIVTGFQTARDYGDALRKPSTTA